MQTLEKIRGKIGTAEELHSVVTTMKGLASINIRQYEQAVESLRDYWRTIEMGMQVLLRDAPHHFEDLTQPGAGPVTVVVLGSDQGMCGPLNREIVEHAANHLREQGITSDNCLVAAVGARAASLLGAEGFAPESVFALPDSAPGITERVQDVLFQVEAWREQHNVARIMVYHQEPKTGAGYDPAQRQVLPLDRAWLDKLLERPWPTKNIPAYRDSWDGMFTSMLRDYVFTALYRAFAESLASENASRLYSIQAAERNIEERLDKLRAGFHRQRQASVTEELLDVVSGFEIMRQGNESSERH